MPEIIPNLHPLMVHFLIALVAVSAAFHINHQRSRVRGYE
jgi:uncharacterized membrane protein